MNLVQKQWVLETRVLRKSLKVVYNKRCSKLRIIVQYLMVIKHDEKQLFVHPFSCIISELPDCGKSYFIVQILYGFITVGNL